ncbi:hypothetical protein NQ317_013082 [Molorchus minor]|uniref:Cytochrome P450 n=1 Tax=Molorchus minor TaxID=1323400 RepID=A0ABQ9JBL3_9CUCU|nr:hypothetical protein NQ317_013082 [Molorchus minor]
MILGANLFAIGGAKWKNLRAKLSPTFTSSKMKAMFQTLAGTGVILEKYLKENVSSEDLVDIKDVLVKSLRNKIQTPFLELKNFTFGEKLMKANFHVPTHITTHMHNGNPHKERKYGNSILPPAMPPAAYSC